MLDFGREGCGGLHFSGQREWLVTNGLGGYAMGTVAGLHTRRYHGLLVAALQPPVGRTVLLSRLEETATYLAQSFPLYTNEWTGGPVQPRGFVHLERFHLEGTTPVWTYACADALLEKRIWMQKGANTTYVQYRLRRAQEPLALAIQTLVTYRDHHDITRASDWSTPMKVETVPHGLRVVAREGAVPFQILTDRASVKAASRWQKGLHLAVEAYRGYDDPEELFHAGTFRITLKTGESATLVASTEADPSLDDAVSLAQNVEYERNLISSSSWEQATDPIRQLVLAADQFIVRRSLPHDTEGRSVIAGYPWFSDWGRDTMIALPGLTLVTGRSDVAARLLRTFGSFANQGMLPNRFPDQGQPPEYNTVDATLWYFDAVRAYFTATGDKALLRDLFPVLQAIVDWHVHGTRYQIRVDPADGLLHAGEPGVQLTWMDAKVDDWVVTPRIGKPVEVNALWYNALRSMAEFARLLSEAPHRYDALASRAAAGFCRFWNDKLGYCYDVVDGPEGDDSALRPNQLLAVSLLHSPLPPAQQKAVVDACARHLLTSHGLRSLAPDHPNYQGHYGGDRRTRDAAYHQGTVWGWLIGPFVSAHLRVYRDPALAQSFLEPLIQELASHGVGNLSEIFDGDPPHKPRGCIAQAWTVAEVLRVWKETRPVWSAVLGVQPF